LTPGSKGTVHFLHQGFTSTATLGGATILGFIQGKFSSPQFKTIVRPAHAGSYLLTKEGAATRGQATPSTRPTIKSTPGGASDAEEFAALPGEVNTLDGMPGRRISLGESLKLNNSPTHLNHQCELILNKIRTPVIPQAGTSLDSASGLAKPYYICQPGTHTERKRKGKRKGKGNRKKERKKRKKKGKEKEKEKEKDFDESGKLERDR
jgi:hypothetical protein